MVYHARSGAPFKEDDAQDIGGFIRKCSGKQTEQILEEIKRNKDEVIYAYIEWDDKKASYQYRLHQVRNIINHIEVDIIRVGSSEPVRIRATYSVVDEGKSIYVDVEAAFTEKEYKEQIISRAKKELENWVERYAIYKELDKIRSGISGLLRGG
jgi:hypothetical protein